MKRPSLYGWIVILLALMPALFVVVVAIPAFIAGYMACYNRDALFEDEKK